MISLIDVLDELARSLRVLYPNIERIYLERIEKMKEPVISIELISYETPVWSSKIVNKKIDIEIIYFSKGNTVREAILFGERLKNLLGMGLAVKDRYLKVDPDETDMRLVEQDLHYLTRFDFFDQYKPVTVRGGQVYDIDLGDGSAWLTADKDLKERKDLTGDDKEILDGNKETTILSNELMYMDVLHADFKLNKE